MTAGSCLACGGTNVEMIGSIGPVPVLCGSLWECREDAIDTATAELEMSVCGSCGHVWNATFDGALMGYDANYDNALDFSPTFRLFAEALVNRLVARFDLRGKRVAEVGSGKGEFLRQLCATGCNSGLGYDPTYEGPDRDGDVVFIREFFTPGTVPAGIEFVACRHVLEHVEDPVLFLTGIRESLSGAVPLYLEVPNGEFNFSETGPWDLIYPHVSYFNECSLRATLTRAGFEILGVEQTFGGQFLAAEALPSGSGLPNSQDAGATSLAHVYAERMRHQFAAIAEWRDRVRAIGADRTALWGAGSKGVTFLALVDPEETIATVVDANPRKWGRFLPGTGHSVSPPTELLPGFETTVLVMNPLYAREINSTLSDIGSRAQILVV